MESVTTCCVCFRYRCGTGIQGISTNCGDLYGRYLDCQWIDITGVPPGFYLLRLIVNPDTLVPESDHRNNDVTCTIELTAEHTLNHFWCQLSGDWLIGSVSVGVLGRNPLLICYMEGFQL
jgi:lysyl oxidase-like protein 2/3/4